MCVIAVYNNKRPKLEELQKMECRNSDGGGIAFFNDNGCEYLKGLTAKEIMIWAESVPLPFVIHFRLASRGETHSLLCHPFEVTKQSELKLAGTSEKLLFHNGTFVDYKVCHSAAGFDKPNEKELFSDTRAISRIISNNNEKFLNEISGYFAVLDGRTKTIRTYGNFDKEEGVVYSNLFWKNATVVSEDEYDFMEKDKSSPTYGMSRGQKKKWKKLYGQAKKNYEDWWKKEMEKKSPKPEEKKEESSKSLTNPECRKNCCRIVRQVLGIEPVTPDNKNLKVTPTTFKTLAEINLVLDFHNGVEPKLLPPVPVKTNGYHAPLSPAEEHEELGFPL